MVLMLINLLNLKVDLCGEHCPLWAEVKQLLHVEKDEDNQGNDLEMKNTIDQRSLKIGGYFDWTQEVTATFKFQGYCQWFHATCIVSCFFGVVWLTLFSMCGRGGYDNRMQVLFKKK